ncbi:MAG TPA: glycosyl transferase family 1 [Acidobacteria bacterium]|jgi:glycosyltransferase involved in cell wall biosynthesis|nr:glycosyl transferase family 1 [Acidobacteriota bacterium]MDP6373146.1 glycosyltransferase family 4 protein [Vicinamibacterales bacterium]HAK56469.1 glycosyl transferase family 1 [Acidobacteriota bacterium]|tara:strand:- start:1217 stop:2260 length:1044 start_codon:yes stop_codon:yes gene_type:complete
MAVRTVVVCEAQVPFVEGGAEFHVRALVDHLRQHGYRTELVSVPFKWYPKDEILAHAAAWRLLDLSESNGQTIDLAIGLKFPTYFARHPHKVAWLIHQYRAAYELCGTPYADFQHTEADVGLRDTLMQLDRKMLSECERRFTNARNTANRLARYNTLTAEPLYHPPRLADRLQGGPHGDYVLSVGRLESVKRIDLAVEAMAHTDSSVRLVVAGDGTDRPRIEQRVEALGIGDRVELAGWVDDEALIELYAGALGVVYAPYDEDYGYVTLESFLARRPVVTTTDAGGPLEFVEDDVNGAVCAPEAEAIADAISRLAADRSLAARYGEAGYERAKQISWDGVVEKLVGE